MTYRAHIFSMALFFMAVGATATAAPKGTLYANGVHNVYETTTARDIALTIDIAGDAASSGSIQWWVMAVSDEYMLMYTHENGWTSEYKPFGVLPANESRTSIPVTTLRLPAGKFDFMLVRLEAGQFLIQNRLQVTVREFKSPIRLGVLYAGSGVLGEYVNEFTAAIQSATKCVEKFQERSVSLVLRDTQSDPNVALAMLKELQAEGLRTIIAPITSVEMEAIQTYANENGLFLINPISTVTGLGVDDTTFRPIPGNDLMSDATAKYATGKALTTIIPVYYNDAYGQDMQVELKRAMSAAGITVTEGIAFDANTTDFATIVTQINQRLSAMPAESTGHVAVHLSAYVESATTLFEAAYTDGGTLITVPWLVTDSLARREEIFSYSDSVLAFARAVSLTGIVPTPELSYAGLPLSPNIVPLYFSMRSQMDSAPVGLGYFLHDAVCLACLTEVEAEAANVMDATAYSALLQAVSSKILGTGGLMSVSSNDGDATFGEIGIYTVSSNASCWTPVALYAKDQSYTLITTPPSNAAAEPVTIGVMLPFSGSTASIGLSSYSVFVAANSLLRPILRDEALFGRTIQYEVFDTESNPERALISIKEMKAKGVSVVIGPIMSTCLEAIQDYAAANDMVILSPTSTSMSLAKPDNIYRLAMNDAAQTEAFSRYMKDKGFTAVLPVACSDVYGNSVLAAAETALSDKGISLLTPIRYETTATSFADTIAALEASLASAQTTTGAKVAIFLISYDEGVALLEAASASTTLDGVSWFGADGIVNSSELSQNANAAVFARNTSFTAYGQAAFDQPDNASLLLQYSLQMELSTLCGTEVSGRDLLFYDAVSLAVFASKTLESFDATSMKKAITNVSKDTHAGRFVGFDENGDRMNGSVGFYQFTAGNAAGQYWQKVASCAMMPSVGIDVTMTYFE